MTDPMIEVQAAGSFNIVGDDLNSTITPWTETQTVYQALKNNSGALFETNGNQSFLVDGCDNNEDTKLGAYYSLHNISIWANPKVEEETAPIFVMAKPDNSSFQLSMTNCNVFDSRGSLSGQEPIISITPRDAEGDRRISTSLILRDTFFYKEGNNIQEGNGRDAFIYADYESTKRPSNWLISNCIFYHGIRDLNGTSSGIIVTKVPIIPFVRSVFWLTIRMNNNEFNWNLRNSGGSPYILYDLNNDANNRNSILVINKGSSIASCNTIDTTVPIVRTEPNMIGAPNLFGPIIIDRPITINRS
jgi:hypothetical protein